VTDTTQGSDPLPQDDDTAWPDNARPTDDPQPPDDTGEKRRDPAAGIVRTPPD